MVSESISVDDFRERRSPIKRVSIRLVVVALPAIAAVFCGWIASTRRSEQRLAIDHYRSALRSGHDASPNSLVAAYGIDGARDVMVRCSTESSGIVFDGMDRWAQVLRVPNASQLGGGDGYMLYAVGDTTRHGGTLPHGAVLQRLSFEGDEIVFCVYGNIRQGSYMYNIPKSIPAEFRIKWVPGTLPPAMCVADLMSRQYCIEANRSN